MRVRVIGDGLLARTTRTACESVGHRIITTPPYHFTDIVWICHNIPENFDTTLSWLTHIPHDLDKLPPEILVLISSQIAVGTTRKLADYYPHLIFAYSPENIRSAHALPDFLSQTRRVIGRSNADYDKEWSELLLPFIRDNHAPIFTDFETAEMAKHALNTYLALSIVFSNEIARIAKAVGANAETITQTLLTERRVSPHAPLHPGLPYGGGHLARDVSVLTTLASQHGVNIPVLAHIHPSNEEEKERWHSEHSLPAHQDSSASISSSTSLLKDGS